jgi:choice-of-anchor B domain-containing protein
MTRLSLATLTLALLLGLSPAQGQSPNVAADQVSFGRTVAVGADHVFVGAPQDVNTPGRVYVYAREGGAWTERELLEAEDGTVRDGFGAAIATDGDRLVVGAPAANAVYVFRSSADGWTQAARLTPTDSTDGFGTSLALAGDRLFVGSETTVTTTDGDTTTGGAAHLFRQQDNGTWSEARVLRSADAPADAGFARTLAASGEHLLVGAPGWDGGAVVAFQRGPDGWAERQTLRAANLGQKAQFGTALAWAGDQALVGAPRALDATGAVVPFTRSDADTTWSQSGRLLPMKAGDRAFFGMALAATETNLWVGAPGPVRMVFMYQNRAKKAWPWGRAPSNDGGALYRFERDGDTWTGAERIAHPGTEAGDGLGATLAASESVVATGLPGDDYGAGTIALRDPAERAWTSETPIAPTQGAAFTALTGEERPCADGQVDAFSCQQVDLKSFLPTKSIGGPRGVHITDIWGWKDPQIGTEYALVGRTDGIAFVDVSTPTNPVYVGELPQTEKARINSWGDVKVYEHYAFAVADNAGDHGMQVFDLRRLRDVAADERPVTFDADALYDEVNSVHNIFVNAETDYAYLVGSSGGGKTCGGGLHMVNVEDPLNPTFEGCFTDPSTGRSGTGATHDVQCVVYEGPDANYQGREICVGSNETAISIADVTNKDSTARVATASYPDHAYVHQGWFGENQRYFYLNDELDEVQGKVDGTRTLVWDLKDLDNPQLVNEVILDQKATDHNMYVEGGRLYEANYTAGLRILDLSDPTNPTETAHFDTKPRGPNDPGFAGAWSNYPFFESGIVVVSSIDEGLFVLEKPKQGL